MIIRRADIPRHHTFKDLIGGEASRLLYAEMVIHV
jgi:hypothetical protein